MFEKILKALVQDHQYLRGEVKMFDLSAVIATLASYALCAYMTPQPGWLAVGTLTWTVRSVLSLWEKLAACKAVGERIDARRDDAELMAYDRGIGNWRIRLILGDIPFFGLGLLCAIRVIFSAFIVF